MSKLKVNWDKMKEDHKQLIGYDQGYIIECKKCGKAFRTTNIDYILCKECSGKKSPKGFFEKEHYVNTGSAECVDNGE